MKTINSWINQKVRIKEEYIMTDIRHYSDQELSLLFLNDEGLYRELMKGVRLNRFSYVRLIAYENFVYNDEQLQDLEDTFNDELIEYEQE